MKTTQLAPETDSQRNLRLLAMAIVDAKNALTALENQGATDYSVPPSRRVAASVATDEQIEAAQDAVNAAELAWHRARYPEVA